VVSGSTVKVINQTGHKLISGYPEGRRMWLNIKWYDHMDSEMDEYEEGAYGPLTVTIDGDNATVDTILDPYNTQIYEAHYGMTQEWAAQLVSLGWDNNTALSYDRISGDPDYTLGDLATADNGSTHETFHFVLNNTIIKDNRIPPYRMSYDEARKRNALPVPPTSYGNPGPGGEYNYWDEVSLTPPPGAASAKIDLLYQPTSWEYIQFLYLANNRQNAFLGNEGVYMLEAWQNTGMAAPHTIATAIWYNPDTDSDGVPNDEDNCPYVPNPGQSNCDSDELGDACDPDFNDADGDGIDDNCDTCPNDPDNDIDNDGICGDVDPCPNDADNDADNDGHCADEDNCPSNCNTEQSDHDGDGIGDVCDPTPGCGGCGASCEIEC
jgi:hypothetical protein